MNNKDERATLKHAKTEKKGKLLSGIVKSGN